MSRLEGQRVLVVEDESMVAMLIEDMLLDLGCEVVVAMRLDHALSEARARSFDLAVLDVNLGDARSFPVADLLWERGTPFAFATGYGLAGLEAAYRTVPVVQKPYQQAQLQHLLEHLLICPVHPVRSSGASPCRCEGWGRVTLASKFRAESVH